jgi:hypothetical protein
MGGKMARQQQPPTAQATNPLATPMFGVWIVGLGWLSSTQHGPFMTFDQATATDAARLYGRGARVYRIDDSLAYLQPVFLDAQNKRVTPSKVVKGVWYYVSIRLRAHKAANKT